MNDVLTDALIDAHRWLASAASQVIDATGALNTPYRGGEEFAAHRRAALGAVAGALSQMDTAQRMLRQVHEKLVPMPPTTFEMKMAEMVSAKPVKRKRGGK
jgi:hypothetical protein